MSDEFATKWIYLPILDAFLWIMLLAVIAGDRSRNAKILMYKECISAGGSWYSEHEDCILPLKKEP